MLLGEQGGGYQDRHLFAAVHRDEGCAHGHFGLAKAHVAAHQAVHRLGREHVGAHSFDGGLLVWGFFKSEAGAEGGVVGFRVGERVAFARRTPRIDVEQLGGDVAHLFGGLALGFLPGFGAQAVQWRQSVVAAGVARDQVQVGHRYIELGAFGVLHGEEFGGLVVDFQGLQAQVATDTVVDMHHRRAFAQLGEVLDYRVVVGVGAFFATATLHHALAEQGAFRDQRQGRIVQQQTFIQWRDSDRQAVLAGDEVRPAVDGFRTQLQAFEQFKQDFATAGGFGGKQHAAREVAKEVGQCFQGLVGLGLDRQVRQHVRGEALTADAGLHVLLAGDHARPVFQAGEAVFHRQEQLGGR